MRLMLDRQANKKTDALSMAVAANVKQILVIVLAIAIFNLKMTILNSLGIIVTLLGGAMYAKVGLDAKTAPSSPTLAQPLLSAFENEKRRVVDLEKQQQQQ